MNIKYALLIILLTSCLKIASAEVSPLNIDEDSVDLFLPVPAFIDEYYRLRRSYQPFGGDSTLDFETAIVQASTGSVRITQLKINGVSHWADLIIQAKPEGLMLEITDVGTGIPPVRFPRWVDDFPELELDFNLTSADIYGPPTRIRLFDVGINDRLYDVDFILDTGANFIFSSVYPKGYVLYAMTPDEEEVFIVASHSDHLFTYVDQDYLNFSEAILLSPLALPWEGEDGEQSIVINYAAGSQLQTMMATDGILLGTYSPPLASPKVSKPIISPRSIIDKSQLDAELNQCIDKKTALIAGFKSDNNLSQQLTDMVFSIAGHSSLTALSSKTTQKIIGAIADSKDVVLEMMANGKVDEATLGIYVSSTLMKNLTPEEYEVFIEQIWGENNIPNRVQTAANVSGSAAETNYKLAAQALAEGIANHAFPLYTTAVKTVIQSVKYAKDTLADDAFQELYKTYKASGGNFEDVVNLSVLSTNKFANQKVREILKSQEKEYDDKAVSNYLQEKMQTLFAAEQQMAEDKLKLQKVKASYLALSPSEINVLKSKMGGQKPFNNCDLFQQYLAYVTNTELDLRNSLKRCSEINNPPSISEVEKKALDITQFKLREGDPLVIRANYQQRKLSWVQDQQCLNIEYNASDGKVWQLVDTILSDFNEDGGACNKITGNITASSYSKTIVIRGDVCNRDYTESITFTGTWTTPPATLVPGSSYPTTLSLTKSNSTEQSWPLVYMQMEMDHFATECGFATSSKNKINTDSVTVTGNPAVPSSASWSGTFIAPAFGYAGSSQSNKFQIKAGGNGGGCARYIYEWSE